MTICRRPDCDRKAHTVWRYGTEPIPLCWMHFHVRLFELRVVAVCGDEADLFDFMAALPPDQGTWQDILDEPYGRC